MVVIRTIDYNDSLDLDCSCGCEGWWDDCEKNKSNRDKFVLSPPPSPHRTNDDWFTQEYNPLYTDTLKELVIPNIPTTRRHIISTKFLSRCVDKYFNKENC